MNPLATAILITWRRNGAYALRLVADLSPSQFVAQPIAGRMLNHPAWVLSHLNVYTPLCTAMLRGRPFTDPIDHPHGQKSEVSGDAGKYEPAPTLVATYRSFHDEAEKALVESSAEIFAKANPLERWRTMHPTVGDMLVTLMVKHESGHLGQLSAWRRAMGLVPVAM